MKETITITGARHDAAARQRDERYKEVFIDCAPFTDCGSEIKNTQVRNAKDLDVVTVTNNLIECSNNCSNHVEVYSNISEVSHARQIMIL